VSALSDLQARLCAALCSAADDVLEDVAPDQLWQPEQARAALGPEPALALPNPPLDAPAESLFLLHAGHYELPGDRWSPIGYGGERPPVQQALSDADLAQLADEYRVPVCHLRAVLRVESAGSGFLLAELMPARPKVLFEAHHFYRLSRVKVSKVRPDLSTPRWNRKLYKGGSAEWGRLSDAAQFDLYNALKSASWGLGQVMGFNFELAGCQSVAQFVFEAFKGEAAQFRHVLNFIDNSDLLGHLRAGRWASFARGYNGAGFRANRYDEKLAAAARRCR
jgi:hypothetical protein